MDKLTKGVPTQQCAAAVIPRQMSMRFDNPEVQKMSPAQRARVITYLASLLMQAVGLGTGKERNDDER